MIADGLDLPTRSRLCSRLDRWLDRDACRGGAFMENVQPSSGSVDLAEDDDPVYPCNWVPTGEKRRCYQIVTSRILGTVEDSWERTAAICAEVEHDFVGSCFRSLGRDISNRTNRDPAKIAELCAIAREYDGEGECVEAAAYDMTANFTSAERAASCASLCTPECAGRASTASGSSSDASALRRNALPTAGARRRRRLVDECIRGGSENLPHA